MSHEDCPYCTDRNGRAKRLYPTEDDARRTAAHVQQTRGVELRVYQCDYTWGYHLTSDLGGRW